MNEMNEMKEIYKGSGFAVTQTYAASKDGRAWITLDNGVSSPLSLSYDEEDAAFVYVTTGNGDTYQEVRIYLAEW